MWRKILGLFDLAGLESLGGNPDPLNLPIGHLDPHALYIRLECTLCDLGYVGADPTAFLGETLAVDYATADAAFTCDYTNS